MSDINKNAGQERDNQAGDNRNHDDYRDPRTRTFNEDEDSWKNKNQDKETTESRGTKNNDWDENDQMQRSPGWHDEEEERRASGDYIDTDHSDYNRGNSRFGWYEPRE
ncbi:hypothetical protein [Flavobacterium rhizosphaerae]|uniref:Uncharacterized protein n=1 Tax=Flavobacterium rhizosphaerae TaxID=3163298 RepID=A0ABW8YZV5_9FLAO